MDTTITPQKPFRLFRRQFLFQLSLNNNKILCKRNYKYVNGLQIGLNGNEKKGLETTSKLKYVSSLHRESTFSEINLPLWQKLVKQHRKCLRDIRGDLYYLSIQRLLPQFPNLSLTLNEDRPRWRLLAFQSGLKELVIDFCGTRRRTSQSESEKLLQDFLAKTQSLLCRSLSKMKDLEALDIKVPNLNPEVIFSLVRAISEKVCINSLKHFGLIIFSKHYSCQIEPVKIDGALQLITKLHMSNAGSYPIVLSPGEFKHLAQINLSYDINEPWDLIDFKDFINLKKMNLNFTVSGLKHNEEKFCENFSLPPALESLGLVLPMFYWCKATEDTFENDSLYIKFFERLQQAGQSLRSLNLTLTLSTFNSALHERFAHHFLQQFTQLEKLTLTFHDVDPDPFGSDLTLDIEHFWRTLTPSKETLQSVALCAPFIVFPETIEALELRFPRLQSFELPVNVVPSTGLGAFCKSFSSLENIRLPYVKFSDEKELECFLNSWASVDNKMTLNVTLDVEEISNEIVIKFLMTFLSEAEMKGKVELLFHIAEAQDMSVFEGLRELIEKKKDQRLERDFGLKYISLIWE